MRVLTIKIRDFQVNSTHGVHLIDALDQLILGRSCIPGGSNGGLRVVEPRRFPVQLTLFWALLRQYAAIYTRS